MPSRTPLTQAGGLLRRVPALLVAGVVLLGVGPALAQTVVLELEPNRVAEGSTANVNARISGTTTAVTTVTVSATAGTAESGDFSLSTNTTLTIAAGTDKRSTGIVEISTTDDTDSDDETVTVSATATGGVTTAPANVTLTIEDDDSTTPRVMLTFNTTRPLEGGDATVRANIVGTTSAATTVTVNATGITATAGPGAGADFTLNTASNNHVLTIPAGTNQSSSGSATIAIVSSDGLDHGETFEVSASVVNSTDNPTPPASQIMTIVDDSAVPFEITAPTTSCQGVSNAVCEGDTGTTNMTFGVSILNANNVINTAGNYLVDYTVTGATKGTDYTTASASGTVTIPCTGSGEGGGCATRTISVVINGDTTPELDERLTVTLSNPRGPSGTIVVIARTRQYGTIVNDDASSTVGVTLLLDPSPVTEGAVATVTARISGTTTAATTVTVAAAAGTAESGDFTLSSNVKLTIPRGTNTNSTGTVTISASQDTDLDNETVTVSGTAAGGTTTTPTDVTLTINDDDSIVLTVSPNPVAEGAIATVTARSPGTTSAVTTVTVTATAGTAESGDFTLSSNTVLSIVAGTNQSSTGTVTITANTDADTDNETVTVDATAGGGMVATASDVSDVVLTITDPDTPTITLALSASTVTEGTSGNVATVTATLSGTTTAATTVTVSAAAGTAEPGDFTLSTNTKLTFAAGQTSSTGTVTITANEDTDADDETVSVSGTASNPTDNPANPADVTLIITDDDTFQVTLAVTPNPVTEGTSGNVATVTATLNGTTTEETTVTVAAAAGSGTDPGDFTLSTNTMLTVAAGQTSSTGTVTITANEDDDTSNETVTVSGTASTPSGTPENPVVAPSNPADVTLTITDDDTPSGGPVDPPPPPPPVIDPPQPPGNVKGEPGDDPGTVSLSWTDPEDPSITNYRYRQRPPRQQGASTVGPGGARFLGTPSVVHYGPWTDITGSTASTTSHIVSGLTAGVDYGFQLQAVNAGGASTASAEVITRPRPPRPAAPTNLSATEGDLLVTLSWTPPPGPITRYEYCQKTDSSACTGADWTTTGSTTPTFVVTGLTNDTAYTFRVRAVNSTGAGDASAPVSATPMEPRLSQINRRILPDVMRSIADHTITAISKRIKQAAGGRQTRTVSVGGHTSLTGVLAQGRGPASAAPGRARAEAGGQSRDVRLKDLLPTSEFVLPLKEGKATTGLSTLTLWGNGAYRQLADDSASLDWDGDVFSAYLGADVQLRRDLLTGVALSWNQSDVAYQDQHGRGRQEMELVNVQPYVGWTLGQVSLWATGGYGWGELGLTEPTQAAGQWAASAVRMHTLGAGASGSVWEQGPTQVRLKSEVLQAGLTVEGGMDLRRLILGANRLRLSGEAVYTQAVDEEGQFQASFEAGLRHDDGDGRTGSGAELVGGLRYDVPGWVTLDGQVHTVLGRGGYDEWGVQGLVQLGTEGGSGLSFSLRPGYGPEAGDGEAIWQQDWLVQAGPQATGLAARVEAVLGYGVKTASGLVTPYGTATLRGGSRSERLGLRWAPTAFEVELEGGRAMQRGAPTEHAIRLQGRLRF